jgi:hypothetical protein
MSTIAPAKLICTECQRENEVERVYCHHCGARLDRTSAVPRKEPVVDTRKRVKKMFDPQRARLRALFFKASKLVLGAALIGLLIDMALPPDMPAPKKTDVLASQVRMEMEDAISKHQPPQVELTDDQVNAYLASALKTKKSALNKPMVDFTRAIVAFKEGVCTITLERAVAGTYPVYTTTAYSVSSNNGKIVARHQGGAIGRLQLHPALMQYIDVVFSDVWAALDHDRKLLARFAGIQFHDKRAVLSVTQS